jgi:FtsP/CotA-like multicopper oxidase with cupredoxin domain
VHENDIRNAVAEDDGAAAASAGVASFGSYVATRREFLAGALTVTGLALTSALLPAGLMGYGRELASRQSQAPLRTIGQLRSEGGRLRGVLTIRSGNLLLPKDPALGTDPRVMTMRYLEGKGVSTPRWPPPADPGAIAPPVLPGPTLRARVGDRVELAFFNHVDSELFEETGDRIEDGQQQGCDLVVRDTDGSEIYPGEAKDKGPNCFHGSSTSNIHFHGTHVTPDGLGDNVLLQLRPDPRVTEDVVEDDFEKIFAAGPPDKWEKLPQTWRDRQLYLLEEYDNTAPWNGGRGLPADRQLLPPTRERIARGEWPQYQIGAYPYCFDLTDCAPDAQGRCTRFAMGQAPGTHWYHAHKHGSTALNVYHGLAGAFIIEGAYDDALHDIYPNLVQHVLVVQNYAVAPFLNRGTGAEVPPSLWVNGDIDPIITMRPGEVQLWRFVNASARAVATMLGFPREQGAPEVRQIAQDGVQFRWENFHEQRRYPGEVADAGRLNTFATGNRIDLLVKAPMGGGPWAFQVKDTTQPESDVITLLTVKVAGEAAPMEFPTQEQYPRFPDYLEDIPETDVTIRRKLVFGWEEGRDGPKLRPSGAPHFTIDGHQFQGDRYDQTMVLDTVEEWTITNTTSQIAHPFHIHVNPFQVVEIYDPATNTRYTPGANRIWQDVIAIPPSRLDGNGNVIGEPGSVRIRHKFVDFAGSFVLHCHMLAHEDRGMMQLVRVIPRKIDVPHH